MKRNKVVIVALIVLCITVVMSVLVTRKDLCGSVSAAGIRRSPSSQPTNLLSKRPGGESSPPLLMQSGILNAPNFFT